MAEGKVRIVKGPAQDDFEEVERDAGMPNTTRKVVCIAVVWVVVLVIIVTDLFTRGAGEFTGTVSLFALYVGYKVTKGIVNGVMEDLFDW